jgi:hypothetical protein
MLLRMLKKNRIEVGIKSIPRRAPAAMDQGGDGSWRRKSSWGSILLAPGGEGIGDGANRVRKGFPWLLVLQLPTTSSPVVARIGEDHLTSRGFGFGLRWPSAWAGRTTWLPTWTGFGGSGEERPMSVTRPWHELLQASGREGWEQWDWVLGIRQWRVRVKDDLIHYFFEDHLIPDLGVIFIVS